jgi:16S rRNA (adenine1518-N6/adenine1519-N6)-dimethyltransferase
VTNSRDELLVQQRSSTKDSYPLHWTSSASGHLDAGEGYLEAAERELREEMGLEAPLEFLVKLPAGPETSNEHTVLFGAESDEDPTPDPSEVAAVARYSLDDLSALLHDEPGRFDPPFRTLLQWYLDRCNG